MITERLAWWVQVRDLIIEWVFPPQCFNCGRVDTVWCSTCRERVRQTWFITSTPLLDGVAATGVHTGQLQRAVQALKYEGAAALATPLGERMAACWQDQAWPVDLVVPVPLHTERLHERGYNQAQRLAEAFALVTGLRCQPDALQRLRATRSQVGLNRDERLENMADAFTATRDLTGHTLLLIDDVFTTGATLGACAAALREAGASQVYALTVTTARS